MHKRFGEEIDIKYFPNAHVAECSLIREMKVEVGTKKDWEKLAVSIIEGIRRVLLAGFFGWCVVMSSAA